MWLSIFIFGRKVTVFQNSIRIPSAVIFTLHLSSSAIFF